MPRGGAGRQDPGDCRPRCERRRRHAVSRPRSAKNTVSWVAHLIFLIVFEVFLVFSPPAPNPFRTDLMPRDFLALLNAFAWVMRCSSPSSPAARAITSSSGTPMAPPASTSFRNSATTAGRERPVMACFPQNRAVRTRAQAALPRHGAANVPGSLLTERGQPVSSTFGAFARQY
jgi:hypothetical protein